MAIDFKKFNEQFPAAKMKEDMKKAAENGGDFDKLPDGEYTCKLEKLELGESQKHQLMVKAMFRIQKGDHKKQCIFRNCVLTGTKNDGFMMVQAKKFLESLDSGIDVVFEDWEQFNDLIEDIADAIDEDDLTYVVSVSENEKNPQYQDIEIVDIIE